MSLGKNNVLMKEERDFLRVAQLGASIHLTYLTSSPLRFSADVSTQLIIILGAKNLHRCVEGGSVLGSEITTLFSRINDVIDGFCVRNFADHN